MLGLHSLLSPLSYCGCCDLAGYYLEASSRYQGIATWYYSLQTSSSPVRWSCISCLFVIVLNCSTLSTLFLSSFQAAPLARSECCTLWCAITTDILYPDIQVVEEETLDASVCWACSVSYHASVTLISDYGHRHIDALTTNVCTSLSSIGALFCTNPLKILFCRCCVHRRVEACRPALRVPFPDCYRKAWDSR